ncbi:MAG: thiamine phosphate synthase [Bryobacteraceae bacterium]
MKLPKVYPILDSGAGPWPVLGLAAAVAALAEGGARIVQFRHKGAWTRALFAEAREGVRIAREAGVLVIIDDRADIAVLLDCGLHVGQDDLPPAGARRVLGAERVLGFSTHNPAQIGAAAAEPVDYLALGPIFPTASKSNPDPVVGIERLGACRALTVKPLVAIGGITRATAAAVWAAGADSIAVIGDMVPAVCTPAALRQRMEEWQQLARM